MDFDAFRMVRGVTVHDIDARGVDQSMCEFALRPGNGVSPVASPVKGNHDHVAATLHGAHLMRDARRGLPGKIAQQVYARPS